MLRTDWYQLPLGARSAIEAQAGTVLNATTASSEGLNSEVAVALQLENGKKIVLKGLRVDHPGVVTQHREAMIAPFVGDVTPRLLWQIEVEGWNFLTYFLNRSLTRFPGHGWCGDHDRGPPGCPVGTGGPEWLVSHRHEAHTAAPRQMAPNRTGTALGFTLAVGRERFHGPG